MKQLSWARGAPAAIPVEHIAVCLQRERSRSTRAGLSPRVRAPHPLIHTTNCTLALSLSLVPPQRPAIPLILSHSQSFVCFHARLQCFYTVGK